MRETYTIGGLAKAAGLPTSTVRYYERRGLLQPDARTRANYRVYGPESVERLRFIRSAQATGFRLEDIALLLEMRDGTGNPCGEVQHLLQGRLGALEEQLAELLRVQGVLRSALDWCHASEGRCEVLDDLVERSSQEDS